MKLFKRKDNGTHFQEQDLHTLSDDALLDTFQEAIKDYARGVDANWILTVPAIDDAMTVADSRDYIHQLLLESAQRMIKLDVKIVRELDARWQDWIVKRIPTDMAGRSRLYPNNNSVPKEEWWWWIEELDKLSDDQKAAL